MLTLVLVFLGMEGHVYAFERPTLPAQLFDQALVDKMALAAKDEGCVADLVMSRQRYVDVKGELAQLKKDSAPSSQLDSVEKTVRELRRNLLSRMETCGQCMTQPIERGTIAGAERTEHWFVSDASCKALKETEDTNQQRFQKARAFLLNSDSYAKYNGGFWNVLEFFAVDPESGKKLAGQNLGAGPSFNAFIAVRNHEQLSTAFSYYMKGQILKDTDTEFLMSFQWDTPTPGFTSPAVWDVSAGGSKSKIMQNFPVKIMNVLGMWYLRSDGYTRYFTAGDFSFDVAGTDSIARRVLLETVTDLFEHSQGTES